MRYLSVFIISLLVACSSSTPKTPFKHEYTKVWDRYSLDELKDSLHKEVPGIYVAGCLSLGDTSVSVFARQVNDLIADVSDDWNKEDSLFPAQKFTEIRMRNSNLGSPIDIDWIKLDNQQANNFLSIINDPTSFVWSFCSTKMDTETEVQFLNEKTVVFTLSITPEKTAIQAGSNFKLPLKMKSGALHSSTRQQLRDLVIAVFA